VPDLAGSELFGHERGAFTGAAASRDGAFKLAENGTLFLDEVGELPLPLQAQLLRAVQEKTYKRVGGNTWRRAEFRLICATNRDLGAEVAQGRFRRDLYYRIAGLVAHAPPLRERASDILPLAEHFLREQRGDGAPSALSAPVRTLLVTRDYPGNVRDLRQLIHAIGLRHHGNGPVTVGAVPPMSARRRGPKRGRRTRRLSSRYGAPSPPAWASRTSGVSLKKRRCQLFLPNQEVSAKQPAGSL
jgi:transcriptional regulator with GAF, ATPase, and Fis domain